MSSALIDQDCVLVDVEAASSTELLSRLADDLAERGYVADTFRDALLAREEKFPTGLPTNVLKVAIPHTDPEHVHRSFISVARLARPVAFHEMGNNAATVDVEIVFLLAIADGKSQLGTLQALIGMFSDEPTMRRLRDAADAAALYAVVEDRIGGLDAGPAS
ncbi:PTS sugar transporter subunit IIA [Streptomyces sp. DSM 44915]|uniref:PTS sugar transporter subunit IIA n=1 Tax=Streptomyces chisholmiae TaxID=3075540 RepID=A0ABU2JXB1_9ACTN|nr:PTS sugar transporter subunit IIA [Streptomyces sp. DSM 44915]MDT0269636.1 PTS sugar transporter subunit IIA [Streptomyces sp. DSM 44915]